MFRNRELWHKEDCAGTTGKNANRITKYIKKQRNEEAMEEQQFTHLWATNNNIAKPAERSPREEQSACSYMRFPDNRKNSL